MSINAAQKNNLSLGGSRAILLVCLALLQVTVLSADSILVRHTEGLTHGFLVLRTLDGEAIAAGDLNQTARGGRVYDHLVFRFKDGSIHEETTVFSQRGNFLLLTDHLVQKGPAFKHPLDVTIAATTGQVTVRYQDDKGKDQVLAEHMDLPPDLANGMLLTLLKNIRPDVPSTKVSMVVATPKPRLVHLLITPGAQGPFSTGGLSHQATDYTLKVEIGGVAGVVAPLVGKQPPDTHVWILGGDAPAFVKLEGPLAQDGPIWRVELTSPIWPKKTAASAPHN
jgi:hypothetical protein